MGVTSVVLAGAGLVGCAPGEGGGSNENPRASASDVEWTQEADVVVVGFGGSGAAAAIEANKAGAKVVILELTASGGGSTAANGGFIMMGGTKLQEKFGLTDSVENFYNYLSAAAGENVDKEAVRFVCDSSPDLYEWCVECGMDFESGEVDTVHHLGGYNAGFSLGYSGNEMARAYATIADPVPRGHMAQPGSSGQDMFAALKATVESADIEVLYEMPGSYLIADDAGRVVGVAAGEKGDVFIKANKGVVLTCGGFIDNKTMYDAFYPFTNVRGPMLVTAGYENGSGILMGIAAGADTQGMGCFQIGASLVTSNEPLAKGILVNGIGRRIVAEDEYNSFVGKAIIQAPTSNCYLIIDDATLQEATGNQSGLETLASGSNVEELAAAIGLDAAVLKSTVDFYQESAALGEDREFGKSPRLLKVLEGALHAIAFGSGVCYTATLGGLRIDLDTHVLNSDGKVIPGLYSAGRNAGTSIYGWYMGSGSDMLDCLVFGRVAGQKAAAA
jgi:3-oxo-5alpha-steroid 4-dehydrogenase